MENKQKAGGTPKTSKQSSIETLFERFPHLSEQIFGELKGKCLPICKEVCRIWSNKIEDYRLYLNRKILRHSKDSDFYENEWKLAVEKMPLRYLMAFERNVYHYMRRFDGKFSPLHVLEGKFAPLHVFAFYQNIDWKLPIKVLEPLPLLPIKSFKIMMENIPMTYGAKRLLELETNRLSVTELNQIVNIVAQSESNLLEQINVDEVILDFEKLKPSTLRAMENFVVMTNLKKKRKDQRSKRKKWIEQIRNNIDQFEREKIEKKV